MDKRYDTSEPMTPDGTAFGMGYMARQNGAGLSDNPFRPECWLGRSWRYGWIDANIETILSPDQPARDSNGILDEEGC